MLNAANVSHDSLQQPDAEDKLFFILETPAELQEISDVVFKQEFIWVQQQVHKYVICAWRWERIFAEVQSKDQKSPKYLIL